MAQRDQQPNTKKRVYGRPFPKGQSGNPHGRSPEVKEVRDLARQYTKEAIENLVEIGRTDEKGSARVAAWTAVLDRAWGKPAQEIDLAGTDGAPLQVTVNVLPREK